MESKEEEQHVGAGAAASTAEIDEDEAAAAKMRARAQGRGRRGVVFSESVKADANWAPVVIEKSEGERAEILAVMGKNILLQGIDPEGKRIIVGAMTRKSFGSGDVIIKQGDLGDYYYIIADGTADITVNGKLVLQASKGMGFGELALLYDAPRAASVTATSPEVHAWAIDRNTFKQVIIGTTMRKRDTYAAFLSSVPILSTLTQEEINTVADALQPVTVSAGEVVVRQGDADADRFYIIEDGELKAEIDNVAGEVCDRLKRGSYFGERALLTEAPRAATVTAVVDSSLLAMDRASFIRLMGPLNELLQRNFEVYEKYTQ